MRARKPRSAETMPRRPWTAYEDDMLRSMKTASASGKEIADVLGRTPVAVKQRAFKIGADMCDRDVHRERAKQGLAASKLTPEYKAAHSAGLTAAWASNPGRREQAAALAKARDLQGSSRRAISACPVKQERQRERGRKLAASRGVAAWSWCPAYLAEAYRGLKLRGFPPTEAKRIVLDDFTRDLRRALKDIAAAVKPLAEEQRRQYYSIEAEIARARINGIRENAPFRAFHLSAAGAA